MKKIFSFLLSVLMLISLTACSGSTDSGNPEQGDSVESSEDKGEIVKITIALPSFNTIPNEEASQAVGKAISEYVQGLGYMIEVEVQPCSMIGYDEDMNMRLAGGEERDIIYTGPIGTAVANGYLVNLDEYRDNELKDTMEIIGDWDLCGMVGGSLYGIPAYKGLSNDYKYIYNQEYFKDFDMTQIHSIDDLDGLFAQFKEKYPDELPTVSTYRSSLPLYCEQDHTAIVGNYFATVGDGTNLVSLADTAAYKKAVEKAYEWRQKGYVDPEGSTQTLIMQTMAYSGAAKGIVMGHAYSVPTIEQMFNLNNEYGATFKAISIAHTSLTENTLTYGIAYTSKHPKEAAEVLNLIWTDEFVMSTMVYGLEGVSWEWNEDKSSIQYPEGLDMNSVPYTCLHSCGVIGNQFLLYGMDSNTSNADKEYMKELIESAWVAPLFGFTPNSENVATQIAAVSNVYDQYDTALIYGDIDPSVYLSEFQSALKDAGIDDIIEDYQAQIDEWIKSIK